MRLQQGLRGQRRLALALVDGRLQRELLGCAESCQRPSEAVTSTAASASRVTSQKRQLRRGSSPFTG